MAQNEFLATYGTEFEELDDEGKDPVHRRPTAIHDEIATDTEGRRRFHGAFTGGFSAGYFNTVGSRDGWAPSEFRSSRDERAQNSEQRAEDFMDEEDLGEFGISTRRIRQTSNFSGGQGEKRKMAWEHDGVQGELAAHIESMVVKPVRDSIGIRMLRKMGWREGRGVGLVTAKERRGRITEADRAQMSLGQNIELSAEDEEVIAMEPIEGTHGLGYTGLDKSSVLNERFGQKESAFKYKGSKGRGIKGQAFGVGAFEEDDDNVYSSFDLSQYDFALDGPGKAPQASTLDSTFLTSSKRLAPRKFFAPPILPPSFKGMHKVEKINEKYFPAIVCEGLNKLNPVQRAKLLGEDRTSVMELVSDADRNRLTTQRRTDRSRWSIKKEEPDVHSDRVEFPNEPMKQKRFKEYLYYLRIGHVYPQPSDMSVWEWESEKKEFDSKLNPEERAMLPEVRSRSQPLAQSSLAMPLQELLQSKFVSEKGHSGKSFTKDEDKMSAVKMGFFGDKTRTTYEWHPHKTLAKLFNVPNPFPNSSYNGCAHLQKSDKKETLLNLGLPNTAAELAFKEKKLGPVKDSEKESRVKPEPVDIDDPSTSTQNSAEIVKEIKWERPPADLFTAIFADSESEDDEADDEIKKEKEEEEENEGGAKIDVLLTEDTDIIDNEERERLEEEKRRTRREQWKITEEEPSTSFEEPSSPPLSKNMKQEVDDDVLEIVHVDIGPKPPPNFDTKLSTDTILQFLKEDLEKAKREKKQKKHHKAKKDKKEKDKKKKSKKNKKEKKSKKEKKRRREKEENRRRSDSESDSDSTVTLNSD